MADRVSTAATIDGARTSVHLVGDALAPDVAAAALRALDRGLAIRHVVGPTVAGPSLDLVMTLLLHALPRGARYEPLRAVRASGAFLVVDDASAVDHLVPSATPMATLVSTDTERARLRWQRSLAIAERGLTHRSLLKATPSVALHTTATVEAVRRGIADAATEHQAALRAERAHNLRQCLQAGARVHDLHLEADMDAFRSGAREVDQAAAASILAEMARLVARHDSYEVRVVSAAKSPVVDGASMEITRRGSVARALVDGAPGLRAIVRDRPLVDRFQVLFDSAWDRASAP